MRLYPPVFMFGRVAIADADQLTLFAPTDEAFAALSADQHGAIFDRFQQAGPATNCVNACIHPWKKPAGSLLRPMATGTTTYPVGTLLADWGPAVAGLLASGRSTRRTV